MNTEIEELRRNFRIVQASINKELSSIKKLIDRLASRGMRVNEKRKWWEQIDLPDLGISLATQADYRVLVNTPSVALLPDTKGLGAVEKNMVARTYYYLLVGARLTTVGELLAISERDVLTSLKYRNAGRGCFNFINVCLINNGVKCGMSVDSSLRNPKLSMTLPDFLKGAPATIKQKIVGLAVKNHKMGSHDTQLEKVSDFLLFNERQLKASGLEDGDIEVIKERLEAIGFSLATHDF